MLLTLYMRAVLIAEIVELAQNDLKIDSQDIFSFGFSNVGFWVFYLTGKGLVNAGIFRLGAGKAT